MEGYVAEDSSDIYEPNFDICIDRGYEKSYTERKRREELSRCL